MRESPFCTSKLAIYLRRQALNGTDAFCVVIGYEYIGERRTVIESGGAAGAAAGDAGGGGAGAGGAAAFPRSAMISSSGSLGVEGRAIRAATSTSSSTGGRKRSS